MNTYPKNQEEIRTVMVKVTKRMMITKMKDEDTKQQPDNNTFFSSEMHIFVEANLKVQSTLNFFRWTNGSYDKSSYILHFH
jgi:hypothetical protein